MQKKGQFFLIAALVIVALLIGLGTVYVATKTAKEQRIVYDLSDAITQESAEIIKSGIFQGLRDEQIREQISNLSEDYFESHPDLTFTIFYGDESRLYATTYTKADAGSIVISFGGGTQLNFERTTPIIITPVIESRGTKKIFVVQYTKEGESFSKEFELKKGQNFFVIVGDKRGSIDTNE